MFGNISDIINRSKKAGIEKILTIICTTDKGFSNILSLVEKDEIIYGTYGIHHEASQHNISKYDIIIKAKSNKKIIGIGGIWFGLLL